MHFADFALAKCTVQDWNDNDQLCTLEASSFLGLKGRLCPNSSEICGHSDHNPDQDIGAQSRSSQSVLARELSTRFLLDYRWL